MVFLRFFFGPVVASASTATFAGGCFWCLEAVFQRLPGVTFVVSGYTGGHVEQPSYEQVSTGRTGHAEAVQISFDDEKITYDALLETFFHAHDPTTKDRQGGDHGPHYRSAIFCHGESQKAAAVRAIANWELANPGKKVVTEVQDAGKFWDVISLGEQYHHNYYNKCEKDGCHNKGYSDHVIRPKLAKIGLPLGVVDAAADRRAGEL
mmetsp:Transcript_67722/g.180309  ORF Transcript_67722/g.180309 Transcript_67722/m.180309 type:complete len:207 (+) Transcript_67722:16-636(+)